MRLASRRLRLLALNKRLRQQQFAIKKGGDHISPSPGVVSCSPLNKSKYQSNVKNLNETEVISSFVKVGKSSF